MRALVVAGACVAGGGCASSVTAVGDGAARVELDRSYAAVFDAARDAVREMGWDLERVDAARGIIRTRPRAASGWITPWIPHSTTAGDAWTGVLQHDERVATVRFRPAGAAGDPPLWTDLRDLAGPWEVEVTVEVLRRYQPDRRADPTSVRFTHLSPGITDLGGTQRARIGSDFGLAERVAGRIEHTQTGDF